MDEDSRLISINGETIKIENLVDLHTHWPLVRNRLDHAIQSGEIADQDLRKIVEWLIILGEKTLFRIE